MIIYNHSIANNFPMELLLQQVLDVELKVLLNMILDLQQTWANSVKSPLKHKAARDVSKHTANCFIISFNSLFSILSNCFSVLSLLE